MRPVDQQVVLVTGGTRQCCATGGDAAKGEAAMCARRGRCAGDPGRSHLKVRRSDRLRRKLTRMANLIAKIRQWLRIGNGNGKKP